jgi:hypothetical protein
LGFYTNITISNDFWHDIQKDPKKLVEGINIAMTDGTQSPINDALDARPDAPEYRKRESFRLRYQTVPQGVVVHRAQHADTPQVIVNTYGSYPIAAHELPHAIDYGWLYLNKYNKKHAEDVAQELEDTARRIRKAIKEKE